MATRIKKRIILLLAVWIILVLLTLTLLSSLENLFSNNPEGRTIVSLTWAGYIVSNADVTDVSASWIVPQLNTSAGDGYSSTWIGIGGQNDKTLIQVGTEQDLVDGEENYYAWYEMLPNLSVLINGLTIFPGDSITAKLTLVDGNANLWTILLSDTTNGKSFSLDVIYNSSLSSGEWIMERPTVEKQIIGLCDFGTVKFTDCLIKVNNVEGQIGNFSYSRIQMTNQETTLLASTSVLGSDDSSFSVSYLAGS